MSSLQLDAWERGFSYAYDAPLDMRMDPTQETSALTVVNEWPRERIAQVLRSYGEERYAGTIAREIERRRPLRTTSELVPAVKAGDADGRALRRRPPRQAHLPGDPDRRQRRARLARRRRCRSPGSCSASVAASARSPSTRSRTGRVKRFLADRARGCVCPPELPVCVCGREPEAELLTRRAVAPKPEERREQPALALGPPARGAQDPPNGGEG